MAYVTHHDDRLEEILTGISQACMSASTQVQQLKKKLKQLKTNKGLSFLELKNQLLLEYLVNLTHIINKKINGQSISSEDAVLRLAEIRTTLEKMRPLEKKLKYQIDKLLKMANVGSVDINDPLNFKPRPDNLMNQDSDEDQDSDDDTKMKSKVYRPPKLMAVHYEETSDRAARETERARQRALGSSLIRDVYRDLDDRPQEIRDQLENVDLKQNQHMKEQTKFEEKYFVRMNVSKKQKHDLKRLQTSSGLGDLTKFDNISALTENKGSIVKKRKRSSRPTGRKGAKKGKKRRK